MNFDSDSLLENGDNEIEDLDAGWQTYTKILPETVTTGNDIDDGYQELRHPLAPGTTVQWSLHLLLTGNSGANAKVKVVAPTDAIGGFTALGKDMDDAWNTEAYGADDFNSFVGAFRGGAGGSLLGYDVHSFEGTVQSVDNTGMLRFQLQGTGYKVMPGSQLRVRLV